MASEAKRDDRKAGKIAYAPPELKALGSLYEITKGPHGGNFDGPVVGGIGGFHVTPS